MIKNIALVVMFALLCAAAWWIFNNPPKADSPIVEATKQTVDLEVGQLNRSVNEKGEEAVTADVTDHALSQAGFKTATDSAGMLDSIKRLLELERGHRSRVLESYTSARAEIRRLQAEMEETDTSFTYKDKWLTVDVKKPLGGKPALLNSTYNAELNWIWYRERKHLFAPLKTYGRFSLNDPNARILGVKHIRIEPPADKFSVDIMAVGEYYRGDVLMGGGISIDAGRFRLQGAYLTDGRGQWYPAFRGGYKLISF